MAAGSRRARTCGRRCESLDRPPPSRERVIEMMLDKHPCRFSCRCRIAAIAMHQDQRDRALGEEPDFACTFAWPWHAGAPQQVGQVSFEQGLVSSGNETRRVARQIGKLDDEAREA